MFQKWERFAAAPYSSHALPTRNTTFDTHIHNKRPPFLQKNLHKFASSLMSPDGWDGMVYITKRTITNINIKQSNV